MAATIGNARSHLWGRWVISEGISDPNKTEIAFRQSIRQEIRQKLGSRLGSFRPHSGRGFGRDPVTNVFLRWYKLFRQTTPGKTAADINLLRSLSHRYISIMHIINIIVLIYII